MVSTPKREERRSTPRCRRDPTRSMGTGVVLALVSSDNAQSRLTRVPLGSLYDRATTTGQSVILACVIPPSDANESTGSRDGKQSTQPGRIFMAEPQGRDPKQVRSHVDDIGDEREVERISRGGWRWWWIWPVVLALAFWWAGWGWGGTGGWWWGRVNSQNTRIPAKPGSVTTETLANAGAQQTIDRKPLTNSYGRGPAQAMTGPGVPVLTAQDKKTFVGQQFAASDVPVQQKVNDRAMWIGEKQPMLAVVIGQDKDTANKLVHGQVVDATGKVEKAPSEAQAKREWNLSDKDASHLEHEGAYIEVSQLTVPPQ